MRRRTLSGRRGWSTAEEIQDRQEIQREIQDGNPGREVQTKSRTKSRKSRTGNPGNPEEIQDEEIQDEEIQEEIQDRRK